MKKKFCNIIFFYPFNHLVTPRIYLGTHHRLGPAVLTGAHTWALLETLQSLHFFWFHDMTVFIVLYLQVFITLSPLVDCL